MNDIQKQLQAMAEESYRRFHSRLIPTVDPARVLGVRVPQLRRLARQLDGTPEAESFLRALPHTCYEENNLHAFLIERIRDYDACVDALCTFLPYVDNWATCDSMAPRILISQPDRLHAQALLWIGCGDVYTVRYGIGVLMRWFLGERFTPEDLVTVATVPDEAYYVSMMVAWYLATAMAVHYKAVLPLLEQRRLSPATQRRTVQKAIESRRLTSEQKAYLRTLK